MPWVGTIVSGSPDMYCNNLNVARVGDFVVGCHTGRISAGSNKTYTNNKQTGRLTDPVFDGPPKGFICSGSGDTFSG